MEEIIRIHDQFYILSTSPRLDERTQVLKHGDTFAVLDPHGDITPFGQGGQGLYHDGTRHLSRLELRLLDRRPFLLGSTLQEDPAVLGVDLTNPDVRQEGGLLPRDTIHLYRSTFLWNGAQYERYRIRNYGRTAVPLTLSLDVDADFADIFEVRGTRRARRGRLLPPELRDDGLTLAYEGLDGRVRATRITTLPGPTEVAPARLSWSTVLDAGSELTWFVTFACGPGTAPYDEARARASAERAPLLEGEAEIASSNGSFQAWVRRSRADLHMMITRTAEGPYPHAGIPWFSTVFGRDGLWTAMETLWVNPDIARGVLAHLAARQATETSPEQDAEPGKILHEVRGGEMAALREIPFGLYYGSVDATPLFVILAGEYYRRTGDVGFLERLWPSLEAALRWIDTHGDRDGDDFVEYERRSPRGLANQGWKDSGDAIFHADGSLAEGPIALCEVQGYVYAARRLGAALAERLGRFERADDLHAKAERLRRRFEEDFWLEDLGTYALALDGRKRPCRVRTSNAGHLLFTGIASAARARRVAEQLLHESSFSGWGIRTVAATETRFNPMSYHNGSVWPHDNAIIALGLSRCGFPPIRLLSAFLDASAFVEFHRLPELFCGFDRRPGQGPTRYPVACSPQAWSSGAVFLLLQACLGLEIDAPARTIRFRRPALPDPLERLVLRHLRVGSATVDLALHRHPQDVDVTVLRRDGDVEIVALK